ncbi:MAG: MMPL family transporter [Flavobacteriaceae bacterium]|nr:MMPL family transporter [Flavobacteriaceae bacterium]
MTKLFSVGFWAAIARIILKNRILILILITIVTIGLASQFKNMRFTYTEANLLPVDHAINKEYFKFVDKFGDEGNLIIIGIQDDSFFTPEKFNAWNNLGQELNTHEHITNVIGVGEIQNLVRNDKKKKFDLKPLVPKEIKTQKELDDLKKTLYHNLPFYEKILYNSETNTFRTLIYVNKDIINKPARKELIEQFLVPKIEAFNKKYNLKVRVSGMPYIRTLNSNTIISEIAYFILAALFVTGFIFFLFFKSFRATFISLFTVVVGVMWTFGLLGLLQYEITVLTAIIPPLIIVIGIPNCIFLINKYQSEVKKHGNQAKSLQRVITKIGNATLMTNVTTAAGFATFILTKSDLLSEFGTVASLSILSIFILSLLLIPIIYSFMPLPKQKHLNHLNKKWIDGFVNWMVHMVKYKRITIYTGSLILLIASMIGIFNIKVTGSLIEDMPQNTDFFRDIRFFEKEFDGIMPVEFMIDTKRKKGVMKLATLKRMDKLEEAINEIPELSKPMSIVGLVKYTKQAYYNGNPKYYQLPTSQEKNFILSYAKNADTENDLMKSFVDSTGQYARITTFMKDISTDRMEAIEKQLKLKITKIFPEDRYEVIMTGKALVFQKGTKYLRDNLFLSLGLAIVIISLFMAYMFRSFRMIVVSLIPNLLPLVITAGLMGFLGVPIKPSTILVFSIAFGISVDDTIHFLAKYRQELQVNNWKIRKSVYAALRETGVSMFYTSIVLFFGFSVFTISSFGGTVALGGLVSVTLLLAMLANLLLLPSLLLSLERSIANKKTLKEPSFNPIPEEDLDA